MIRSSFLKYHFNLFSLNIKRTIATNLNENYVNLAYDLNDKHNSNKALVIAHGLFASKASWRALSRRINDATKQKIYTVDMRNHGDSEPYLDGMNYIDMANDLKHFIEKIVIEKDKCNLITLMGHSMGGKAAMSLALSNITNKIDKLIVADVAPSLSPSYVNIKSYLNKMREVDLEPLNSLGLFKAKKQVELKLCELDLLKNDPAQRQFILTRLIEKDGKILWGFNINAIINHLSDIMEFPNFNSKFDKPTLFMGGELSHYITQKEEPYIAKYFTNYKIIKISKAGHVIHFDNPTETINAIHSFIN